MIVSSSPTCYEYLSVRVKFGNLTLKTIDLVSWVKQCQVLNFSIFTEVDPELWKLCLWRSVDKVPATWVIIHMAHCYMVRLPCSWNLCKSNVKRLEHRCNADPVVKLPKSEQVTVWSGSICVFECWKGHGLAAVSPNSVMKGTTQA